MIKGHRRCPVGLKCQPQSQSYSSGLWIWDLGLGFGSWILELDFGLWTWTWDWQLTNKTKVSPSVSAWCQELWNSFRRWGWRPETKKPDKKVLCYVVMLRGWTKTWVNDGDDTSQQHAPWQHRALLIVKCVCVGKIKFMLKCEAKTIYRAVMMMMTALTEKREFINF